jgi:hypothetical protein
MAKLKIRFRASDSDDEPSDGVQEKKKPGVSSKKLMLFFAAMFIALFAMVVMAPAKEKEGVARHYQTLGLKPHASAAEVKKAYR